MKTKLALLLIILIALFFRFFHLAVNPPSLTWDEASWGYNAYSLGIDGRDEFGKFLPYQYLESFGDFKPPLYAYLDILPVKIWGLTAFATRFPSAFFGVLTVLITYFLVKQIFPKSKYKEWYSLIGAGVLAISPWHILLSRAAFEANIATFFLTTGVWLFLYSMQKKPWLLVLSSTSFVASLYTFNSARVVAPLLVCLLGIIFFKTLWKQKGATAVAILVGLVCVLPITKFLLSPQANLRFQEVNIFSDVSLVKTANQEIANDKNASWSKIIHNRRLIYSLAYVQHYFDNLTPSFLFIHGDGNPKFSIQDVGQLYLWDIPFFLAGLLFLFKKKEGNWWVIPLWLLVGIIPAATARETPHALRTEATLPMFQVVVAYGFINSFIKSKSLISQIWLRNLLLFVIVGLLCINISFFTHHYFIHYPREFSKEWQYGYKDAIAYVEKVKHSYQQVYITSNLGRPYIYYLFYTKLLPSEYRKTAKIDRDFFGFVNVRHFAQYSFGEDVLPVYPGKNLYIGLPQHEPKKARILKTFYLLDGTPVLEAYTYE